MRINITSLCIISGIALLVFLSVTSCNYLTIKDKATRDKEAQIDHFNNIGYNDENDRYVNRILDRGLLTKVVDKPYDDQDITRTTLIFDEFEIEHKQSSEEMLHYYAWPRDITPFIITYNNGSNLPTTQRNRRYGQETYNDLAPATYARIFMMLANRPGRTPFKNVQEQVVSVNFTPGFDTVWVEPIKKIHTWKVELHP